MEKNRQISGENYKKIVKFYPVNKKKIGCDGEK